MLSMVAKGKYVMPSHVPATGSDKDHQRYAKLSIKPITVVVTCNWREWWTDTQWGRRNLLSGMQSLWRRFTPILAVVIGSDDLTMSSWWRSSSSNGATYLEGPTEVHLLHGNQYWLKIDSLCRKTESRDSIRKGLFYLVQEKSRSAPRTEN